MSFFNDQLKNLQSNLADLLNLNDNPFDTSNFSGNGAIEQLKNLQNVLGNAVGLGNRSGGNLSGSVGRGGTNNSADVRRVQELLNQHNAGLVVDGAYGNNTLSAIMDFQRSIGMGAPDGLIEPGKGTWQALSRGRSTDSGPGRGGLQGSVGAGGTNNSDDVQKVQQLLNRKGANLSVDGQSGNMTESAIRAFQAANGLPTDGLIEPGRNTWKKLSGTGSSISNSGGQQPSNPSSNPARPTDGSYRYHTHPNWRNIDLVYQPGSRTAHQLNANAERLLRSIIASAGLSSTIITSTKRTYADQAYITLTQVSEGEAFRWYHYVGYDPNRYYRYIRELNNGGNAEAIYSEYGEFIKRISGEGASNHIPGFAIDVTGPGLSTLTNYASSLVPVSGSGVRTVFPETGRTHIEFTFVVV